jgi:hypothetical protein
MLVRPAPTSQDARAGESMRAELKHDSAPLLMDMDRVFTAFSKYRSRQSPILSHIESKELERVEAKTPIYHQYHATTEVQPGTKIERVIEIHEDDHNYPKPRLGVLRRRRVPRETN